MEFRSCSHICRVEVQIRSFIPHYVEKINPQEKYARQIGFMFGVKVYQKKTFETT